MSKAISVHIERTFSSDKANKWRNHDLRIGQQSSNIAGGRSHLNRVLVEPPTVREMRERAIARRAAANPKRKMKSNASFAERGLISFGHEIQAMVRENPILADRIYMDLLAAIESRFEFGLLGLVVHEDESAPHAHFWMDAYDRQGRPASRTMARCGDIIQDIAVREAQKHLPEIERGKSKRARIAAGEGPKKTRHRSPDELRSDLSLESGASPNDIQEAVSRLRAIQAQIKDAAEQEEQIKARIRDAKTQERELGVMWDLAWIAEAITAGELRIDPGRTWARGYAMSEDAWPETQTKLDTLDLTEHAWTTIERVGRAMRQVEVVVYVDAMLHMDCARLRSGSAWEKGGNASRTEWSEWKPFLDSLDLPTPVWRRIAATAAAANRRRMAWAAASVLPLLAAGAVVPDPGHPGRWKAEPHAIGAKDLPDELAEALRHLSHDQWEWAIELAGLLADPTPERAAAVRARGRTSALKLAADAARLDDAWTGAPGDATAVTLPEPTPRND